MKKRKRKRIGSKKDLNKLKQTKKANQDLAHEIFLGALKSKSVIYKPKKGKGSFTRNKKHKNKGDDNE